MSKKKDFDPADKFTGLSTIYDKARPGYPVEALRAVLSHCALEEGSTLVDVGCGTGISARAFAQFGLRVIGVEPNSDMRLVAESANKGLSYPAPSYQPGRAEATGLPPNCADAVAALQAFHWFEPDQALIEFRRILKHAGWVILVWNERQESDPFTKSYGDLIRNIPKASELEVSRSKSGEILLHSELFENSKDMTFQNEQILNEDLLIERAFSSSYAPRQPVDARRLKDSLKRIFNDYEEQGVVVLKYVTNVYLAQKHA